jgi:hypothetical protein
MRRPSVGVRITRDLPSQEQRLGGREPNSTSDARSEDRDPLPLTESPHTHGPAHRATADAQESRGDRACAACDRRHAGSRARRPQCRAEHARRHAQVDGNASRLSAADRRARWQPQDHHGGRPRDRAAGRPRRDGGLSRQSRIWRKRVVQHRRGHLSGTARRTVLLAGPTRRSAGPVSGSTRTAGPAAPRRSAGPAAASTRTAGAAATPRTAGPAADSTRTAGPAADSTRTAGPAADSTRTAGPASPRRTAASTAAAATTTATAATATTTTTGRTAGRTGQADRGAQRRRLGPGRLR